jgi:hypothetical protein
MKGRGCSTGGAISLGGSPPPGSALMVSPPSSVAWREGLAPGHEPPPPFWVRFDPEHGGFVRVDEQEAGTNGRRRITHFVDERSGELRQLRKPDGSPTWRQLRRLNAAGALELVRAGEAEPISKAQAAAAIHDVDERSAGRRTR